MRFNNTFHKLLIALLFSFTILGCGGGTSSEPPRTSTGNQLSQLIPTETTWLVDEFEPYSNFAGRCENPRIGSSPITGQIYPDQAGSELLEKFWQRSFNNETYLWYQEVVDKDPNNFGLEEYFQQLKTTEVTDSGVDKDQFHYTLPTSELEEQTQLGVTYGYGVSYKIEGIFPPRELQVTNITPNTEAFSKVSRGSKLLEINGVDFINSTTESDLEIIYSALSTSTEGEVNNFKFVDINNEEYEVTLTSETVKEVPLQLAKTLNTPQGNVGYLLLTSFDNATVEKDLFEQFTQFEQDNITDLVVDLRYNGGGFLYLSSQLAYMVAGKTATTNKTYERFTHNDKLADYNEDTVFIDTTIDLRRLIGGDSIIEEGQPLPELNLSRVYVLTTGDSCSASEAFMNALIGIDIEVIQIGETTCGKPYGFYGQDNCGLTYFTVQFKGVNDKGFGDYTDGFVPKQLPEAGKQYQVQGCPIKEDYLHALGDEQEILLASALYYQANNTCPEITQAIAVQAKNINGVNSAKSRSISNSSATYDEPKINVRSPLQEAIINDIYYDKFRHIKTLNTDN
jgi:C-terminal processing protease CtpA/Prc